MLSRSHRAAVVPDFPDHLGTPTLGTWRDGSLGKYLIDQYWNGWLPVFFYFDDYSTMHGRVSLPHIQQREAAGTLEESEKTFLALLATVDADLSDFETQTSSGSPASWRVPPTASRTRCLSTGPRTRISAWRSVCPMRTRLTSRRWTRAPS